MLPNFLIIGAAKAGTTALYQYLRQHPDVYFSPIKEPLFFAYEGQQPDTQGPGDTANDAITDLTTYQRLFADVRGERAVGEASTMYLYLPDSAARISHYIPHANLIAVLRHPADRAYSAYLHLVRAGREVEHDFRTALRREKDRMAHNWGPLWHYTACGFYHTQLQRYSLLFPRSQLHILLYEDFRDHPQQTIAQICRALGIDPGFTPDMSRKPNVSGVPRSRLLHRATVSQNPVKRVLKQLIPRGLRMRMLNGIKQQNLQRPELSAEIRAELIALYQDDISRLQTLIDRDLSHWLT
jgi:hypothetical protein